MIFNSAGEPFWSPRLLYLPICIFGPTASRSLHDALSLNSLCTKLPSHLLRRLQWKIDWYLMVSCDNVEARQFFGIVVKPE